MTNQALIEDLYVAPAHHWPTIIARHEAVDDYFKLMKPTTADVDSFGARLGISRRMFYRLIRERKRRLAGGKPRPPLPGNGARITPPQESVITEALHRMGPGAWIRDVISECLRICTERGIAPPSDYSITTRVRLPRNGEWINQRLSQDADWVLDACPLDLVVHDGPAKTGPAYLVGLIFVASGKIVAFKLTAGMPDPFEVMSVVRGARKQLFALRGSARSLQSTAVLTKQTEAIAPLLGSNGISASVCAPHTLRSGEALLILLGRKVGGVSLRRNPRRLSNSGERAINISLAEAVLASCISALNADSCRADQQPPDNLLEHARVRETIFNSVEHGLKEAVEIAR